MTTENRWARSLGTGIAAALLATTASCGGTAKDVEAQPYATVSMPGPVAFVDLVATRDGQLFGRGHGNEVYRLTPQTDWQLLPTSSCGGLRQEPSGRVLLLDHSVDELSSDGARTPLTSVIYESACIRAVASTSTGDWFALHELDLWRAEPGEAWVRATSIVDLRSDKPEGVAAITDLDGNALLASFTLLLRVSPDLVASRVTCRGAACFMGNEPTRLSLDPSGDTWFVERGGLRRLRRGSIDAEDAWPGQTVVSVAAHPDGRILAVGAYGQERWLFQQLPQTTEWRRVIPAAARQVMTAPDGRVFFFGDTRGAIQLVAKR